jgi:hypothetical protein
VIVFVLVLVSVHSPENHWNVWNYWNDWNIVQRLELEDLRR